MDGAPLTPENAPPAAIEEEPPSWTEDAWEGSFAAESREQALASEEPFAASLPASALDSPIAAADAGPLPTLEALTEQIPADTRRLLDELFRARFVRVARVAPPDLKAP